MLAGPADAIQPDRDCKLDQPREIRRVSRRQGAG